MTSRRSAPVNFEHLERKLKHEREGTLTAKQRRDRRRKSDEAAQASTDVVQ